MFVVFGFFGVSAFSEHCKAQFFCASFLHASLSFCALGLSLQSTLDCVKAKLLAIFLFGLVTNLGNLRLSPQGFAVGTFSGTRLECPRPPAAVCMSSRLFVLYVDQRVAVQVKFCY